MAELYLMLIKITESLKRNKQLAEWIEEIDREYMKRFRAIGPSVAHVALDHVWDFALLFRGSPESIEYLEKEIRSRAPQDVREILTMRATELDEFTRALRSGG